MDDKNEENKRKDKKSLEQTEGTIQKQTFSINLPDGKVISSDTLNDEQYLTAVTMQHLQRQLDDFTAQVQDFELKKKHFIWEQKELLKLLDLDGSTD